ncbi:hypothetical protein [Aquisalibacillus elongatus]|uniref:Uncharacterized protein n=1 Tax=Aquisalibacillus elongatus TaxID=485577 RepID=A0A3N5BCY0_9BACI|nr:hypothetical protein [Aquisalibacillus elongatus]RPF55343.1 hypothetical protein EDC24_0214 [Aquisalibacillus elongatus]
MNRLVIGLTSGLFVITWTFLLILILQPEEPVLKAKTNSISTEIALEDKNASTFYVLVNDDKLTNNTNQQIEKAIEYNDGEGVSIDTLLEILEIDEEAAPNS